MQKSIKYRLAYFAMIMIPMAVAGIFMIILTDKRELFLIMNSWNSGLADTLYPWLTWASSGFAFGILCIFLMFYRLGWGILAITSFTLSSAFAQVLKRIIFPEMVRPLKFFDDHSVLHLIDGMKQHMHHSFPSGHSTTAFAMAALLALLVTNRKWGLVIAITAWVIAFSRVYLAQHFFEDIYAGMWLGTCSTLMVFLFFEKMIGQYSSLNQPLHKLWKKQSG